MKKFYLKTLLLAVGMIVGGVKLAWADAGDKTVNVNIDFSNAITDGVVAGTVNSMTVGAGVITGDGWLALYDGTSTITIPEEERAGSKDIVHVQLKKAWGNKSGMGSGFSLKDSEGETIVLFQYARWGNSTSNQNNLNIDMTGLYGSAWYNAPIVARYTLFDITIDYAKKTITSVVSCTNPNATDTFTAILTNTNPVATFEAFGFGVGDNQDRADVMDDLIIETTEGDYTVETYNYTVNWVCDGTTIKSETRNDESGASITLFEADKAGFTENGQKYFYVSDDAEGKTVTEDASTVVTVNVRQAETWTYTIQAVDDTENVLKQLSTGTVVEGETASYGYPQYIAVDGILYQSVKQGNNPWWGKSFTPTENNMEQTVNYTQVDEGIVFCEEAEDIEGLEVVSGGNTDIRASNRKGAYATENIVITTLAEGIYKMYGATYGNAGTTFTFLAGETTVLTIATNGNPAHTGSEEFTVTKPTDIVVAAAGNGGSSPKVIDYIIIQKTGDIPTSVTATIGGTGYTTFASAYPLDLSNVEGLTAYYVAADGIGETSISLTGVNGTVAAGTGLLLKGTTGEAYSIPVAAEGEALEGNLLVGCTAETTVGVNANAYVMVNNGGKAEFQCLDQMGATIPAGKAYLSVPDGNAKSFSIVLDGESTGIETVKSAADTLGEGTIYNVNGQRVSTPTKGLYIVNGQKVWIR